MHDNPELSRSFAAYITPDGHRARIDLTQADRMFSHDAMDQVLTLRRRLNDYLGEYEGIHVTAKVAGANAESADIRELTRDDQVQSWFVVPIGVFLVLIVALRDPLACLNLVATMVLTYAFALGATHLVFVTLLGAEGLDWKVPYFLFVLLVAVGVDYNVFLMTRLNEESQRRGLRDGIIRAIGQTGGLISSAAVITASSFASFLLQPARLAPPARLRPGRRHPDRRHARPAASGSLRPLAPSQHPRGPLVARRRRHPQGPTSNIAGCGIEVTATSQPARPRYSPVRVSTRTIGPLVEVLGNLNDAAGRKRGRLGAAGCRVAAHAGRRLDDRQLDGVRQLDRDHLVVDDQRLRPPPCFRS